MTGSISPRSIGTICRVMPDTENFGLCRAPTWLNGRVRMTSRPSSTMARRPSCSCANLLSAYGLDGAIGESSRCGWSDPA